MRLYSVPTGEWAGTQADARENSKRVGQPFKEVDVPTDKPGLLGFLNQHRVGAERPQAEAPRPAAPAEPDSVAHHLPSGEDADGFPIARSAFTPPQVHAAVLPSSQKVRDVCHLIGKMSAAELGFVALEVIHRGAKIGGFHA